MSYTAEDVIHLGRWAAQECEWQQSGYKSVGNLIEAAIWADEHLGSFVLKIDILTLGKLVEPVKNADGYRRVQVFVGNPMTEMPPWEGVPRLLDKWCLAATGIPGFSSPAEAFKAFEEIHPFRDGNGRVGAILYNWLNDTLHPGKLELPPNVFGDPRRVGVSL